jgi:hypothetical protein
MTTEPVPKHQVLGQAQITQKPDNRGIVRSSGKLKKVFLVTRLFQNMKRVLTG